MRKLLGLAPVLLMLVGCSSATLPEPAPEPEVVEQAEPATEPVEIEEAEEDVQEEIELTEEDARTIVFPAVFDSTRLGFIEVLGELYSIESVDSYIYNVETGTVELDVTSTYLSEDNRRDGAWEITRLFGSSVYSTLNDGGAWLLDDPRFAPALRVTASSEVAYECDGETMRLLGEVKLSQDDWESACRVK